MARVRMVTRTITATVVRALVANLEENTLVTKELKIGGRFEDTNAKDFQKAIKLAYPDEIIAKVLEMWYEETLYGMLESDFLKYAKVLPPRNGNGEDNDIDNDIIDELIGE